MNYRQRAELYALEVLAGNTPACQYVKQACKRFMDDLERYDIYLSDDAEKWCRFLELLPHVKGKWAKLNQLLSLSDWQIFCTVNIFGWKWRKTDLRRFRDVYIEVPRKNGKTFWVAGIALGMLVIDGEFGAEVYCGATTEKQAWEIFKPAKLICEREPDLRAKYGVEVNAKVLNVPLDGAKFEPIIGDPGDGASPSCYITDEFHEHDTSDQVDTMATGTAARDQPLGIKITTAGSDMGGPCYSVRMDLVSILSGSVEDDAIFGIIYTIDEGDEWDTVEALEKANPNFGISVNKDIRLGELNQARRSATKQASYKTKYLNQWVGAKAAWMNMLAFQACRKTKLNIDDFRGRRCIIGIDLASKTDIASMAVLFLPENGGKYAAFVRHYLPEDTILEGGNTRYKAWHSSGHLIATPGNVIDYEYIEDDLKELKSNHQIMEVPYDPFQATQFSVRMIDEGFPMIELGATVKNFSEPMKELEALTLKKNIEYEMDPVLMWMFGNVVARLDKKDNIFPNKERNENKIDGVIALIMTINRAIQGKETGSLDDFLANPVTI